MSWIDFLCQTHYYMLYMCAGIAVYVHHTLASCYKLIFDAVSYVCVSVLNFNCGTLEVIYQLLEQ